MGQFIAVSSTSPENARHTLSHSVQAAHHLFDQTPLSQHVFGSAAIASFARQAVADESGRLWSFNECNAWCLGVGTWIHHSGLSAEQYGYGLASAHQMPNGLEMQLADIDGSFCFVTGDISNGPLRIITDPVGQIHVYALQLANAAVISTSALLLAHIGDTGWDALAVREFLAKGTVFEDRSMFRNVRKIAPATIQTYGNGKCQSTGTYWSVREHVESTSSPKHSLRTFSSATQAGVAKAFRQFNNPALDLTGGFDSRILLACARNACPDQSPHTVVAGPANTPDVTAATHLADRLGLKNEWIDNRAPDAESWWRMAQSALPLVDGEYDILEYANILFIHQCLANRFGISINGSGGELIRGYWWELLFPRTGARGRFNAYRVALRRYATDPWAEALVACDHGETLTDHFASVIGRANADLARCRNTACMDNVYIRLRMHRWQGRIASATNRIWPCLSPLLFRGPMESALKAPVSLRRNGRMARRVLTDMDLELAQMPMAGGYPALPITLTTLPRFLPLGHEYLQRLKNRLSRAATTASTAPPPEQSHTLALLQVDEVADMLDPVRMLTRELYDSRALRNLTAAIAKGEVPAVQIGRLITLESVARMRQRLRT